MTISEEQKMMLDCKLYGPVRDYAKVLEHEYGFNLSVSSIGGDLFIEMPLGHKDLLPEIISKINNYLNENFDESYECDCNLNELGIVNNSILSHVVNRIPKEDEK